MNKETSNKTTGNYPLPVLNDKRTIRVGEYTERFIKLLVEAQKLSSDIYDTLSCMYGEHDVSILFGDDFSEPTACIEKGLEKYICNSIQESISFNCNRTETEIII